MLLKLLEDKNGEVQNLAVRYLGQINYFLFHYPCLGAWVPLWEKLRIFKLSL